MGMYVGVVSGEVCSVWRCGQWGGVVNVGGGGGGCKGGAVSGGMWILILQQG